MPTRARSHRLHRGKPASSAAAVDRAVWDLHVRFSRRRSRKDGDALVRHYEPHTRRLAKRFDQHREPLADLEQVAFEALMVSLHRFEPERSVPFLAFADPTIVGSLKRYFRDNVWGLRVSRSAHELSRAVAQTADRLHGAFGRPATTAEIADALGVSVTAVAEAEAGSRARAMRSLHDAPDRSAESAETAVEVSDLRIALAQATATLTEQDRQIVGWYFEDGALQSEIAERLRCSQMQVSRHLKRITGGLRDLMV